MELLAPVNADTLQAALDAGADAVYFGLTRLNARRGAKNFAPDELSEVVQHIHAANAKAHLTLNIDLATREIGLATRTLQLASEAEVDAVIVRDSAILSLIPHFPKLQFHLSTQAGVSSSAGVQSAKELGCHRVVLAREMTCEEIRSAAAVPGIETEVFVQGAMCFCCSGRCLLSSWVGGRSGNRGTCASPCRVAWKSTTGKTAHPMSMHDLCLLEHLDELRKMGVASLKIEGRLKSANWVHRAVALYRKALDGTENPEELRAEAEALGYYTGRTLTTAYFEHHFENLTDEDAGRQATPTPGGAAIQENNIQNIENKQFIILIKTDEQKGTNFTFAFGESTHSFRIPWQRIANPRRAIALGTLLDETVPLLLHQECAIECPDELRKLLLPRRCQSQFEDALAEFLRKLNHSEDGTVRCALPAEIARHLEFQTHQAAENHHCLTEIPDQIRLDAMNLQRLSALPFHAKLILEASAENSSSEFFSNLNALPAQWREQLTIALPHVAYEDDLPFLKEIILLAKSHQWHLEVNSWDTLQLVREAGVPFVGGPGLAVLNPLAARFLRQLGAESCTVSPEIDQEKFEDLCQSCEIPLTAIVFGRPPLMTTRAELPMEFAPSPDGQPSTHFEDGRGTQLFASQAGHLTVLRPKTPYDWRRLSSPKIRVAHLAIDLCGSPESVRDLAPAKGTLFLFNFDRTLK